MSEKYEIIDNTIVRNGKEGQEQLTNFDCRIKKQLIFHDGSKKTTQLVMEGTLHDGTPLPEVTIPATDFASMAWVADKWGMAPIIFPATSGERDLRTAIQLFSKPETQHIYTHTGWTTINGEPHYLTTSGGINAKGLDSTITVQLPAELSRYELPAPTHSKENFIASLKLINLAPGDITWVLLLATYRAAIASADFAVHLAGRTGTFKSEITSLFQSHFGKGMDARHLPASWNSTPNAIEHLAYRAMHALFVLDDFVPIGTPYQVRQLQKNADQIIRAQGNQSGRSRLTDVSSMQTTYFPRGIILSTGEDIPEGHSVRGRMLIVELAPGDIDPAKLRTAQDNRERYSEAMASFIQWTIGNNSKEVLRGLRAKYRDENLGLGHTRTPSIVGDLLATLAILSEYAVDQKFLTQEQVEDIGAKARAALKRTAANQLSFLENADPVSILFETMKNLFQTQQAHAATKNGGIPEDAIQWGWTEQRGAGELSTYKMNGPRLGWIDRQRGEFYLDPATLALIKKHSGGKLAVTTQTLGKRMKEAAMLTRTDDNRQRLTVRVTLDGHPRQVMVVPLSAFSD